MSDEWDMERTIVVQHARALVGTDSEGRTYLLAYDDKDANPDGKVCNWPCPTGAICRMPAGHAGPHVPWDVFLVANSGVYVVSVSADPETAPDEVEVPYE